MHDHFRAFTLVELIVVITIVGILSTVGFVSYSGYLTGARDSNRFSQLTKLSDSLQTYAASRSLPLPDDYIEITASGARNVIAYQGYVGTDVLETIDYTNGGRDPKDDSFFTYYLTNDRKSLQLLTFMEDSASVAHNSLSPNKALAVDYSERYPKVYGQKLGVLLEEETNTPAQEISSNITAGFLDVFTTLENYTSFLNNEETFTASGYSLGALLSTRLGEKAPSDCLDGFIGVPGNPEFNTEDGFCVAQYEMTYSDADTPTLLEPNFFNTVSYIANKPIVAMKGKYPITDITPQQAIDACKSMGMGYHLITNNEWMTIARNIESTIGGGVLYNGVSGDLTNGCNVKGGNTEPRSLATKTGPGTNATCNERRQHELSNGSKIWDMAGNVNEYVNKANTLDGSGHNLGKTTIAGSSAPTNYDDNGIYEFSDMQKYGSALRLGTASGRGGLNYSQGVTNNVFMRGGSVYSTDNSGIFAISLNHFVGFGDWIIGFRCAK